MIFSKSNLYYPLPPIKLYGNPLPFSHKFKLLGIILDTRLTWKHHLISIEGKLSKACGILYRIRNKVTRAVARIIYLSIAYPYLIYCNTIWSGCYSSYLDKIITKQKKIIRIIMKRHRNAHTPPLFKKLRLLNVSHINEFSCLVFVFKSLNNIIYSPLVINHRYVRNYQLRNNNNQLEVPFTRHRYAQLFISVRGPNLWNNIPIHIRTAPSLITFKRNLKLFFLNSYAQ